MMARKEGVCAALSLALSLWCFLTLALDGIGVQAKCKVYWDQSRVLNASVYNSSTLYSQLRNLMTIKYDFDIVVTNDSLDVLDFEGVSMLWLDARHTDSAVPYGGKEVTTIWQFVRSGGALLLLADSEQAGQQGLFAYKELFEIFFLVDGLGQLITTDTLNVTDYFGLPNPIVPGVSVLASDGFGHLVSAIRGGDIVQPALRARPANVSFDLVLWGDYFPRGKLVIVWNADVLDDPYYGQADNAVLADNVIDFLSQDCAADNGCQGRCSADSRCFKEYCYCYPGFTGDACDILLDYAGCKYTECLATPAQCTDWNPTLCPNNACVPSPIDCPPLVDCLEARCFNGSCGSQKLCMQYGQDQGCNRIICQDGSCVDSIDQCDIVPSCAVEKFRCPGGECANDLSLCPSVSDCANPNDTLCLDGVCRPACPRYDGCNSTTGYSYLCLDYTCKADPYACDTCGFNTVKCFDGACACLNVSVYPEYNPVEFICTRCPDAPSFAKPLPVSIFIRSNDTVTFPIIPAGPYDSVMLLAITVEAGTFNTDVNVVASPIALGNLRDQIGEFATTTLASIVDLKVVPQQPLNKPVIVSFIVRQPAVSTNQTLLFDSSLVFFDSAIFDWARIFTTPIPGYQFMQVTSTVANTPDPSTPSPPRSFKGGAPHFTPFSVVLEGGEGEGGDGGDGDLDIILPAVLVPVFVVVVVVLIVAGLAVLSYYKWKTRTRLNRLHKITSALDTPVSIG